MRMVETQSYARPVQEDNAGAPTRVTCDVCGVLSGEREAEFTLSV